MYLLHLDESTSADGDHFVVGGLAVHEQHVQRLAHAVDRIAEDLPWPVGGAEIHAAPIRNGRGDWRRVSPGRRMRLFQEIADLLITPWRDTTEPSPVLLATAIHRPSFPYLDIQDRAYEEFFGRCNGFLGRLTSAGYPHRCVAISDKSQMEERLQRLMSAWRTTGATSGARIGPMRSYVEVPLFVDSRASRLIQLADFVAYWVFRAYQRNDWSMLNVLLPAFDQDGGVRHGLVHLTEGYRDCNCPACRSRR